MTELSSLLLIILLLLLLLCTVLLIILLVRSSGSREQYALHRQQEFFRTLSSDLDHASAARFSDLRGEIQGRLEHDSEAARQNRIETAEQLARTAKDQQDSIRELSNRLLDLLSRQSETQLTRLDEYEKNMRSLLTEALKELQESNRRKLDDIREGIDKKLDNSLNERLDASFKTVGEQLSKLYVSLGELSKLESGVSSLNRTLSNVKTRGIFGEAQLENILSNILTGSLYDKNVITKRSDPGCQERVEFAVRIPDKETPGSFLYLPIDSKFPDSAFEHIREASEAADPEALRHAVKELETRVRADARDIMSKYIDPPHTTDFAVMFLPTESLYAEVLRIPGLVEECQTRCHVVITGPTTCAALINSLNVGFRYMAVNQDSQNILRLLSAIKTQYGKLSELIRSADSKLESAKKATTELQHRADLINRKLTNVEELDAEEARTLLGIGSRGSEEL